jgi:hypothetical protein
MPVEGLVVRASCCTFHHYPINIAYFPFATGNCDRGGVNDHDSSLNRELHAAIAPVTGELSVYGY